MPYGDLPLPQLREYVSCLSEPDDFDAFWQDTLESSRRVARPHHLEPIDNRLAVIDSWDVTFSGFGGHDVSAWLHRPIDADSDRPCIVQFVGYGGGRGMPHENIAWAAAGYVQLVVDTRGQGSAWSVGHTDDPNTGSPAVPGFMTRGIESPHEYYYRRVMTDAVLAVELARTLDGVEPGRVVTTGASQGGGLAIAAAALGAAAGAMPDVPFLCDFPRAVWIADTAPYNEIARYLSTHRDRTDQVLRTLSYFDGVALARRAHMPAIFSVALMDTVCPPSTVYAAYNAWQGAKQIQEWSFNNHEGGLAFQHIAQLDWLKSTI